MAVHARIMTFLSFYMWEQTEWRNRVIFRVNRVKVPLKLCRLHETQCDACCSWIMDEEHLQQFVKSTFRSSENSCCSNRSLDAYVSSRSVHLANGHYARSSNGHCIRNMWKTLRYIIVKQSTMFATSNDGFHRHVAMAITHWEFISSVQIQEG